MAAFGMKPQWGAFYGKHITFERLDQQKSFDQMLGMLSECDDLRDYLLFHMKMTRSVFGDWNIENNDVFVAKYGALYQSLLE